MLFYPPDGFVLVMKESVWTTLFGEHFMQLGEDKEVSIGHEDDDMIFFVKCNFRTSFSEVCTLESLSLKLTGTYQFQVF